MEKYESTIKEIELNQTNIQSFDTIETPRPIRTGNVNRMKKDIETGIGLKNAIHVNLRKGLYRIVDGNHRIKACKDLLENNPTKIIKVKIQIYENLTNKEEAELYDVLQKSTAQTINDFITIHQKEIPILDLINNYFPIQVNINSRKEAMLFSHLLKAYASKDETTVKIKNKEDLFEVGKNLNEDNYIELKKYFLNYKKYFGNPETLSPYYKAPVVWLIMSLYFRNKLFIETQELWAKLSKKVFGSQLILDLAKTNSCEYAAEQRRSILINELIRALKEKQPKYFLFENVGALNQNKFRPFLREIKNDLHKQGYQVFYNTINSLQYGTPQSRERVWFIGYRKDLTKPFGWNPYPQPCSLIKSFQQLKELVGKRTNQTPSRDKMRIKCKNITKANYIGTLTLKQDRYPNAGIIDYEGYYRFLTPREAFRCQGFFNDEITLDGLSNNQALDLAGDGWDVNLVSKIFKAMEMV